MNGNGLLRFAAAVALAVAMLSSTPNVQALDVFGVESNISSSPAANAMIGSHVPGCVFGAAPGSPLSFDEAIERALCSNPHTSEAWANVKLQAARVGVSKSAWLPTLSLTLERDGSDVDTSVRSNPQLDSGGLQLSNTQQLVFNWVLIDAGRAFDIDSSESLLEASQANHAEVLLSVFADASHDYFGAQSAAAAFRATRDLRDTAQSSYLAAKTRVDNGVAPVSDALQAQTAVAQADLALARALGELRTATGSLAWRMGLRPDSTLELPPTKDDALAVPLTGDAIEVLIEHARAEHPHAIAAARQLDAAMARVRQARAELLPKLSLSMRAGHNSTPVTPNIGAPPVAAASRIRSASLSITMPLFDGFGGNYRIDQAERSIEVSRAQLDEARQQIASDAWTAWQAVQTAYATFVQARELQATAMSSFAAAAERYRAGVGGIADLLSAQAALTNADNRKLQSLSDWRSANASLWAKLGRLQGA